MHLPVAEYEVNGAKYKVRVPYDIAVRLEAQSGTHPQFVRADYNFGTSVKGQVTKLQGCRVRVVYDLHKPKKAKVVG